MRHGQLYLNLRQSKKRCQQRVNRNKRHCLIPYGLIRQCFPKKIPFAMISHEEVLMVMARLNHRPRKRVGKTLYQVFYQLNSHLAFECRSLFILKRVMFLKHFNKK